MLSLHFILSLTDVVEVFSSGINTWYPYLEKLYCIVLSSHLFISWNLLSCGVVNFCMNEIIMTWKYCFFLRWPKLYCSFLKFFLQLHSTPVAKYPINLSSVPSVILNYFRLLGWHCSQNSGNFATSSEKLIRQNIIFLFPQLFRVVQTLFFSIKHISALRRGVRNIYFLQETKCKKRQYLTTVGNVLAIFCGKYDI
jgi:hypothetical protein